MNLHPLAIACLFTNSSVSVKSCECYQSIYLFTSLNAVVGSDTLLQVCLECSLFTCLCTKAHESINDPILISSEINHEIKYLELSV